MNTYNILEIIALSYLAFFIAFQMCFVILSYFLPLVDSEIDYIGTEKTIFDILNRKLYGKRNILIAIRILAGVTCLALFISFLPWLDTTLGFEFTSQPDGSNGFITLLGSFPGDGIFVYPNFVNVLLVPWILYGCWKINKLATMLY